MRAPHKHKGKKNSLVAPVSSNSAEKTANFLEGTAELGLDAPPPGACAVGGKWFPEGTTINYNGVIRTCRDGQWV